MTWCWVPPEQRAYVVILRRTIYTGDSFERAHRRPPAAIRMGEREFFDTSHVGLDLAGPLDDKSRSDRTALRLGSPWGESDCVWMVPTWQAPSPGPTYEASR